MVRGALNHRNDSCLPYSCSPFSRIAFVAGGALSRSQGPITWCLILVFLPLPKLPIYWIFGRAEFLGYRETIVRVVGRQQNDNHRKIGGIQGQVQFIGGRNVGGEYLGRDVEFG